MLGTATNELGVEYVIYVKKFGGWSNKFQMLRADAWNETVDYNGDPAEVGKVRFRYVSQ